MVLSEKRKEEIIEEEKLRQSVRGVGCGGVFLIFLAIILGLGILFYLYQNSFRFLTF